jgi:hypothetical protein
MMVGINLEYFSPFQTRDPKLQELVFLLVGFFVLGVECLVSVQLLYPLQKKEH